jgi:hypothetical protein
MDKYCEAFHLLAGDRNQRTAGKPTLATVSFWPVGAFQQPAAADS